MDVLTIKEAGMLGATDTDHIALAKKRRKGNFYSRRRLPSSSC
ncbi:hypothetical protein [Candidatus Scalindua japonica]